MHEQQTNKWINKKIKELDNKGRKEGKSEQTKTQANQLTNKWIYEWTKKKGEKKGILNQYFSHSFFPLHIISIVSKKLEFLKHPV